MVVRGQSSISLIGANRSDLLEGEPDPKVEAADYLVCPTKVNLVFDGPFPVQVPEYVAIATRPKWSRQYLFYLR